MRTILIIVGGFLAWGACLGIARLVSGSDATAMTRATAAFVALWFFAAAWNMWVGVNHAGYSFSEELPIFLLIFLLPAVVAIGVRWKFW
jgi:multisubunit Na+/H+ antiporter MnhG subunit